LYKWFNPKILNSLFLVIGCFVVFFIMKEVIGKNKNERRNN
jgi:hypothetical protein